MDEVFKAINDPGRRRLLDHLFATDGQSLAELCEVLPGMTRFGVMNHLRVLEEAGLVTTRKVGRRKLHYLNPVPIRLMLDRWIGKYAEHVVDRMAHVKTRAEGETPMSKPDHVYRIYVNAPSEEVWRALTDGDRTVQYFYGTRVASDWTVGSPITYRNPDGSIAAEGEVLAVDAPRRLEMTFVARWDRALEAEGPSRQVWLVENAGAVTILTVELYDTPVDSRRYADYTSGYPFILSGLKTLLETGEPLPAPA